ncbi:two-component system response regulator [Noviherbaspirillum sp. Root189]|uniref:two-component system response regulator n=1 Tax=Noviherbaspirillum sp. Root189 TaxID=1736487 RepID=UPI0009EB5768|nr:EAL domain-containing protein [Noviherbaspirillum sp. Root189]
MNAPEPDVTSPHTILMVDDTPANLALLAHVLEERGDRVLVAQDGDEALRRVQFVLPDLILLDVMMPGIDGFTTCRRLKENEDLRDVPVIFMTALSECADKLAGFTAGGVDYVTKPFQLDEVLARINTHLALRTAQRKLAEQNDMLQREVALRQEIETYLQHAYDLLEERVALRTGELARANAQLIAEIEERRRIEMTLRRNEVRMRRLVEANIIGVYFWEADGRIAEANDAFLRLLGYTQEEVQAGKVQWDHLSAPGYQAETERGLAELRATGRFSPYEKEYLRKDGTRVPVLIGGAVISRRRETGVAFVLDLSERKRAEERIRYMADHDALTGLPNRALLRDRLQQALAHGGRTETQVAVMFIDLDYFKHINDSLGHEVGDCLLRDVAERLLHCVREGDSVARLGGDEFVLALPLIGDSSDAAMIAQKVLDALDAPFHCGDHELHVSGSIGISLFPNDGTDVETLMRTADTAMYYAKEKGRANYQFFTQSLNKAAQRRHQLTNALRHALAREEFTLFYQPQVDLETGTIFSAEALLRWKRNGDTPVACNEFITIAEETGLILPIGEWVLRQACEQLKRWHESGYTDLVMAVNLSPRQFFQPNFQDMIIGVLNDTGIPADRLDLEITESILMQRTEDNVATLKRLSGMGIKLSIDDFGTGYSSLAYLQRFPVDALKIDRSFVSGIGQDSNDTALVTAIISMANSLRLKVLAEGVETLEQVDFLQSHGCPSAQGYYYSKPVSAEAFTELLHQQSRRVIVA